MTGEMAGASLKVSVRKQTDPTSEPRHESLSPGWGSSFGAARRAGDGGSMAGESVWIVTWLPLLTRVADRKQKALSPEHREFDDPTNAVSFVMGLDESVRATATIRRAGDDAIGLAIIRKMYATEASGGKLEWPNVP
jgi:hypothetical protein